MTTLEILLLILGAVIFIASFIVPESKSELDAADRQLTQEKLQELLQEEMKNVRSQVTDAVDETIHYSMEKTERGLERLTNEKMTAVSEYAQTVLEDIHKNHEEVMFLYDMLNNKHENLKETATEVSMAVKEANAKVSELDAARAAEPEIDPDVPVEPVMEDARTGEPIVEENFEPISLSGIEKLKRREDSLHEMDKAAESVVKKAIAQSPVIPKEKKAATAEEKAEKPAEPAVKTEEKIAVKPAAKPAEKAKTAENKPKKVAKAKAEAKTKQQTLENGDIALSLQPITDSSNKNERVLALHKQGKSNVAIAKELGLGVGEVKLIIDLFKEM
ncbi:hypothetical protein KQI22_04435 [Kineothrix sp. MSJ-39]|uniref:DUF6115 domain-containing protein n=1 Tax=Kineothrix sp. MSJ-39 TaxID=2841533 RepID=UPI001C0F988E|nr:DUF6115 domain-containing protein [Kineothrix sp. MSJ-39]MBU5429319.1 hypothetical protein [Kineothrix sp. MSJ-39]